MVALELQLDRARAVPAELAAAGKHRGVKPTDLLIAAAAEAAELLWIAQGWQGITPSDQSC